MRTEWKCAAGTLLAAGALAVPASASAAIAVGTPLAPCYDAISPNGVQSIPVTLTGGTPGDDFQLIATYPGSSSGSAGSVDSTAPFDTNGDGSATLTDIFPAKTTDEPTAGSPVDLTVEDFNAADPGGYTTTDLGDVQIAELGLNVATSPINPKLARAVTASAVAFSGQPVYGFITNQKGTKLLKRFYLGKGDACGYVKHSEVVAPPSLALGNYVLHVNVGGTLNKKAQLIFPFKLFHR